VHYLDFSTCNIGDPHFSMDREQLIDFGDDGGGGQEREQEAEDPQQEDQRVDPPQQQQQIPPPPVTSVPIMPQPFVWPAGWPVFQQQQAPPPPPRITLTPFWAKDPVAWFRLAESTFNRLNVQDSNLKFDLVLPALPEDTVEHVRHVLRLAHTYLDPYLELKNELVRQFTPNVLEQLNGIIFAPELGGQAPSQLMNKLLSMLPPGEPPGLLFKMHWLLKLPMDIRDAVAKKLEELDPRELARYADSRWHVRNSQKPPVASISAAEQAVEELTGAVAALPASARGRGSGGSKNRGRGRGGRGAGRGRGGGGNGSGGGGNSSGHQDKPPFICQRHRKFGQDAFHCDEPEYCTWTGNGAAAGL